MSAVFLGFHHDWSVDRYENREKCDVTLTWQPNFWTTTIFLDSDVHLHCRIMEETYALPCSRMNLTMHRKFIHVKFVGFFLPYLQDHGLLRSRDRATIATRRNDFSSLQANKTRKRHIYKLKIRTRSNNSMAVIVLKTNYLSDNGLQHGS